MKGTNYIPQHIIENAYVIVRCGNPHCTWYLYVPQDDDEKELKTEHIKGLMNDDEKEFRCPEPECGWDIDVLIEAGI